MQFMVLFVHVSGIWPHTMVTPTVCPDVHPPPASSRVLGHILIRHCQSVSVEVAGLEGDRL